MHGGDARNFADLGPGMRRSSPSRSKPGSSYPEIDPRDPGSIARWATSAYNVWRSKIGVVGIACFRDKLTEKGHSETNSHRAPATPNPMKIRSHARTIVEDVILFSE